MSIASIYVATLHYYHCVVQRYVLSLTVMGKAKSVQKTPIKAAKTKAKRVHKAPETADGRKKIDLITRGEAAKRIGVSITQIVRYEKEGFLTPVLGTNGWHWFHADAVERLRPKEGIGRPTRRTMKQEAGEVAANVFSMLVAGASLHEIVIETRALPDDVVKLINLFDSKTHVVLAPEHVEELAALGFAAAGNRNVVTPTSILEAARALRSRVRELRVATLQSAPKDRQ